MIMINFLNFLETSVMITSPKISRTYKFNFSNTTNNIGNNRNLLYSKSMSNYGLNTAQKRNDNV